VLSEKSHADEAAAEKFKAKMIKEKISKGYAQCPSGSSASATAPMAGSNKQAEAKGAKRKPGDGDEAAEDEKPPAKAPKKSKAKVTPTAPVSPAATPLNAAASPSSNGGEVVYSWSVEYAKSNRSTCQASKEKIDQGAVRIGKEVDNPFKPGTRMFLWHKAGALFDQFRKGAEHKPRIKSVDEIVGFADLEQKDRDELEELVAAEAAFREGLSEAEEDTERFEHPKGVFWSIVVAGSTTRVKWGQIGEEAVLSEKSHADEAAAEKFKAKMVS